MALINITTPADGESADAADVATPLNTIVSEINGNLDNANIKSGAAIATSKLASDAGITNAMIANDTITGAKVNFSATGADAGIWWEELGRTTLSVAGDTITLSGLPVRKYLVILADITATGGTIACNLRFNNDSGNNYADRYSNDGGIDTTTISQSGIDFRAGTAAYVTHMSVGEVVNVATKRKMVTHRHAAATTGAGTSPSRLEGVGIWDNTTDAITRVDLVNTGTGDFAIGSEVVVLGHN